MPCPLVNLLYVSLFMNSIEDFEVDLLLSSIKYRWGYDFQDYARASIKRRINNVMIRHHTEQISELISRVLHEPEFFQDMVRDFSIPVTEMFRDPQIWCSLREKVFPLLRTWPYFKIWHAACATGEEVYSMAILLEEAGLLDRATIYATDFNDAALEKARSGIYPIKDMQAASRNYIKAGGQHSLNIYYYANGDNVLMNKRLREHIVWANHNLTSDRVFGEMNLILCRNVLIYFTQVLQNRVLELFTVSMSHGGFLCLGNKETLDFSSVSDCYEGVVSRDRIYRRLQCENFKPSYYLPEAKEGDYPKYIEEVASQVSKNVPILGVVAIGTSLGGLNALRTILSGMRENFSWPILVTQHVAPSPDSVLADVLQDNCALTVKEAVGGERIKPGVVYLAPADYHMMVNDDYTIGLSSDERDNYARPSINVMFDSVADVFGSKSIGVVLTGANDDGARGLAKIKSAGGFVIVQTPSDAEAPTMPKAACKAASPDHILPLNQIALAVTVRVRIMAKAKLEKQGEIKT